jgi:hypothetical protein
MSGSLKEELLRLGIAKPKAEEPKQRRRDRRGPRSGEPSARPSGDQPARRVQDTHSDAPSSRPARHARDVQASAPPPTQKRNEAADARAKDREREARMARLRERIEAHKLDDPQAEIKQYYSTGKKIKRIYVTEAQAAGAAAGRDRHRRRAGQGPARRERRIARAARDRSGVARRRSRFSDRGRG